TRSPAAGLGLSFRRRAAQPAWSGLSSGRGGAAAGRARQQRPLLSMGRADRGCPRPSRALPRSHRRRAGRALRGKVAGHHRLVPRPRRFSVGIHLLSSQTRRSRMTTLHDPNILPGDLPVPQDDGAARHLTGMRLPPLVLKATDGSEIDLSKLSGRTVVYIYPRTGVPGQPLPAGWNEIPGARGCTPQSCGFRDHFSELKRLGVLRVFGLSTQDTGYQREAVERLHLPFPVLSDERLELARAINLPT